ncbi:50S ribosomal protein L9 [Luteimonas sp. MJ293]|uniref:50S ribosomal protein L9 n=1 Tax=Luteimonas sp. MJ146 TaxID=3129240 RepID=UPI0031BA3FBE
MQVILLQKIAKLGDLGDKVSVKPGYGRNYLVPQGKAVPATAANLAEFETKRAEYEAKAKATHEEAFARLAKLEDVTLSIRANASPEGKLYGSIGPRDIADALTAQLGVEFEKSEVVMGEGPFRLIGENEVVVHLHADVETTVKVVIEPESAV